MRSTSFGPNGTRIREAMGAVAFVRVQKILAKETGRDGRDQSISVIYFHLNRAVWMVHIPGPARNLLCFGLIETAFDGWAVPAYQYCRPPNRRPHVVKPVHQFLDYITRQHVRTPRCRSG